MTGKTLSTVSNNNISTDDVPCSTNDKVSESVECRQYHGNDHSHQVECTPPTVGGARGVRKMETAASSSRGVVKRRGICDAIEDQLEHLGQGTTWLSIFLGQIVALLLSVSAICNTYLVDFYNIHVPNAQNFAFYILLATIFTTILACRPADRNLFPILKTRGWKYAIVALADAEANYLVVKSYQFTTLPSCQLLDCFAIPTVLSLSWLVLRIRFKVPHIFGVFICLLGICCLVWADIEDGRPLGPGKDRFLGDMICLSGAFLYGVSNVAEEFVVKTFDVVEFLGMIGLFGSFVSGAQTVILEYGAISSTEWSGPSTPMTLLIAYATSRVLLYVLSAVVMRLSSATAFNLSILTADFYSLIVGIYLFQYKFHALYFLSFVLVMTGVIVFAIKPTVIASHIYRSLTREHTTTLDLELMASSPTTAPNGYHVPSNKITQYMTKEEANHHQHLHLRHGGGDGGSGSIVTESSHLLLGNECQMSGRSPLLSNQSCDVVLEATTGGPHLGNGRDLKKIERSSSNVFERSSTYVIPEDEVC